MGFLTEAATRKFLDSRTNSIEYAAGDSKLVVFTSPPTKAGTDGTEVTGGGYARPIVPFASAAAGSAGRTGQVANDVAVSIPNMPVASTDVAGFALADAATDEVWFVEPSWTPTEAFAVGGTMNVPVGALVIYGNN